MPPKQCAKCTKTVYPTEELKCLDKVWHKGCFKCNSCNMTLNMKNYKGYNKLPYCSAHYPTTKFTSVADTPENRRIAANTQIQSNIKYHEEFEREKGKVTVVADDPEVLRVKKNMNIISNVSYHGEKDKKQEMERIRPAEQAEAGRHRHNPGRISDYDPTDRPDVAAGDTPYSNRVSAGARQVYDSNVGRDRVSRFSSSGDEEQAPCTQRNEEARIQTKTSRPAPSLGTTIGKSVRFEDPKKKEREEPKFTNIKSSSKAHWRSFTAEGSSSTNNHDANEDDWDTPPSREYKQWEDDTDETIGSPFITAREFQTELSVQDQEHTRRFAQQLSDMKEEILRDMDARFEGMNDHITSRLGQFEDQMANMKRVIDKVVRAQNA